MSAREFDAALSAKDEPAVYKRLYGLAHKARDAESSASLSLYADKYLQHFCESWGSSTRRRWIGVTFFSMVQAAPTVLQQLKPSLMRVGEVLLRDEEPEDVKLMAGLIMRKALAHSVPWTSCWPSSTVPTNMKDFPEGEGDTWIQQYQEFLDSLAASRPHPTNLVAEPAICYAVALVASSDYKMSASASILVVVQNETIVCIATDSSTQELEFVDISLKKVSGMKLTPATLHDSQSRGTKHGAYNLVLKFSTKSWTYQVNTVNKASTELTIIFATKEDAEDCKRSIQEAMKTPKAERNVASSQVLNISQKEDDADIRNTPRTSAPDNNRAVEARGSSQKDAISITSSIEDSSEYSSQGYVTDGAANTQIPNGAPSSHIASQLKPRKETSPALQPPPSHPPKGALTKPKPMKPKPEVSEKSRSFVEDTEDENKPSLALVTKTKSSGNGGRETVNEKHAESGQASQKRKSAVTSKPLDRKPFQATTASLQNVQQHATSSASPKPSTLPKVSKARPAISQMKKIAMSGDVFDVPSDDDSQKHGDRATRKYTRNVNYKEVDDDYFGSEDSMVQSAASPVPAKRGGPTKKAKSASKPPLKKVKDSKARVSKVSASQPTPSSKHAIVSKLAQSMPASVGTSKSARLRPVMKKKDSAGEKSGSSSLAATKPIVQAIVEDEDVVMSDHDDHGGSNETAGDTAAQNITAEALSVERNGALEPSTKSPNGKKRPASSSPPSTPDAKRMRTVSPTSATDLHENGVGIEKPALINNQPKVLEDPSSPYDNTKRGRKNIPFPKPRSHQSVDVLLSSMLDGEEGGSVNASDMSKVENAPGSFAVPQIPPAKRHTPPGHQIHRSHSGSSSVPEVLSSNSKPLPASPHAESMAISGLADSAEVNMQVMIGNYVTARSDPFRGQKRASTSSFTRRLTGDSNGKDDPLPSASESPPTQEMTSTNSQKPSLYIKAAPHIGTSRKVKLLLTQSHATRPLSPVRAPFQPKSHSSQISPSSKQERRVATTSHPLSKQEPVANKQSQPVEATQASDAYAEQDLGIDEETTLVAPDDELPIAANASCVYRRSSPPSGDPSSSHSSTSAEAASEDEPSSSIPTDQAEEMEWEEALEPHQRSVHDELIRLSKRVIRHVVDNETAVSDIVETYDQDGKHLLERLIERNTNEFEGSFQEAGEKKKMLKDAFSKMANDLKRRQNKLVI